MKNFLKRFIALRMTRKRKETRNPITFLERRHYDKNQSDFTDGIYFAGVSNDDFSFVTRLGFRNGKPNENWLKVFVPGEGVWGFENMDLPVGEFFEQGDLKYVCQEPGELWKIIYHGPVYQGKNHYQLKMELDWHSLVPVADFDNTGTSYEQLAFQIAKEKWNVDFFKKLKEIHQIHYEQAGNITGTITWKRKKYDVQLTGVRSHSFGKRNWNDWGRHLWLTGVLDDGQYFNISIIDYDFVKNLKAGFLWDRKGYCNFEKTPSFGDLKILEPLPKTLSFPLKVKPGDKTIVVNVEMKVFFPFTMDNVYYIRQAKAVFDFGGIRGTGIAEMGINLKKYNVIL